MSGPQAVLRRTAVIEATIGAPGLSIPIGLADNNMPVGFQIQTRPGRPCCQAVALHVISDANLDACALMLGTPCSLDISLISSGAPQLFQAAMRVPAVD